MKKLIATVMLLVAAGGAVADEAVRDATPRELTAIKADLEMKLLDASSARLLRVRVKGNDFCGLVNAKNALGAYAGYVPMMGMVFKDTTGKQLAAVLSVGEPEITNGECERKGLPLPPM